MKAYFDSVLDVMPYAIFPDDGLSLDIVNLNTKLPLLSTDNYLDDA